MADNLPHYRGHILKPYNRIYLRVSQFEFKKFIDAKLDLGLSAREFLEYSGKPCEHCINTEVLVYDKDDNAIKVKRGILCKKK